MQNTTNGLDGGVFSPMKKLLKIQWIYEESEVENGG